MSAAAPRGISLPTATSITVANMVGTGVFTSLGFQLYTTSSGFALLMLWVIGGVFALCGALTYGELAAALPRSGGEYHFLTKTFGPLPGFLAGWLSLVVGFAPPIALAAMAFGSYFSKVVAFSPLVLSCAVVAFVTLFHLWDLRLSSSFQNVFTLMKIGLLGGFLALPWVSEKAAVMSFAPSREDLSAMMNPGYGVSLLYVMFAYAGWNAATYVAGEVHEPRRNVPRALLLGTVLVLTLYVGVHWAFLTTTPIELLVGKIEIGYVVATEVLGETGGRWAATLLALALVSTISAMTWAGPRVTQVMGEDYSLFRGLARTNRSGVPVRAILLQTAIVYLLLLTSTFNSVLVYVQLLLTASSALTVAAVFQLRRRQRENPDVELPAYRTWGYPITPLLFLAISIVTMIYTVDQQPFESLAGLVTLLVAAAIYFVSPKIASPES
jgi:APA family basic amino acid/polyamine antiporter